METARKLARERRKRWRAPASKSQRNRAVQAFWAMHVEAMRWSNLSVRVYAHAHHLSPNSLYPLFAGTVALCHAREQRSVRNCSHLPNTAFNKVTGFRNVSAEQSVLPSIPDRLRFLFQRAACLVEATFLGAVSGQAKSGSLNRCWQGVDMDIVTRMLFKNFDGAFFVRSGPCPYP